LIDRENEDIIDSEMKRWRLVLERLFTIIKFLAERNLALRGDREVLDNLANGNFLGQV
jgi:hypothetical protein